MSRSSKSSKDSSSKERHLQGDNSAPDARQQTIDYQFPPRDQRPSPPFDRDPNQAGRKQLDELRKLAERNKHLVNSQVKPRVDLQAAELGAKDDKIAGLEKQVKKLEDEKHVLQTENAAKDETLSRVEAELQMMRRALGDPGQVLAEITKQLVESNNALESLLPASSSATPSGQRAYR